MKMRDRFGQPAAGKIGQSPLEPPASTRRLKRLPRIFHGIVGPRLFAQQNTPARNLPPAGRYNGVPSRAGAKDRVAMGVCCDRPTGNSRRG